MLAARRLRRAVVSTLRSSGLISMSTSSASGSTATVAAEVWMRPLASVCGTRCTRCTPDSNFSRAIDARAAHRGDDLAIAADLALARRKHLDLPAMQRGIALVHAEEIAGEKRRLVAAGPGAHFEDGAAVVGRVARDEKDAELVAQLLDLVPERHAARPRQAPASPGRWRDRRSAPRLRQARAPRSPARAPSPPPDRARRTRATAAHTRFPAGRPKASPRRSRGGGSASADAPAGWWRTWRR